MRKKMRDQNVETGSVEIASGYTTNTRPGPASSLLTFYVPFSISVKYKLKY